MASPPPAEFDEYAEHYGRALERGLAISGESKDFFAEGRVAWLASLLARMGIKPQNILDFGCGTGGSSPFFLSLLKCQRVIGVDISAKSVEQARALHGASPAHFHLLHDYKPAGDLDLAFCNGVFHHIPVVDRERSVDYVRDALKPGGLFAFWENNPWNPGTQWVMKRIAFDRFAVKLSAPQTRHLLRSRGFEILRTDFLFVFPRFLGVFRALEPALTKLPLGAQYMVLARKPASTAR